MLIMTMTMVLIMAIAMVIVVMLTVTSDWQRHGAMLTMMIVRTTYLFLPRIGPPVVAPGMLPLLGARSSSAPLRPPPRPALSPPALIWSDASDRSGTLQIWSPRIELLLGDLRALLDSRARGIDPVGAGTAACWDIGDCCFCIDRIDVTRLRWCC